MKLIEKLHGLYAITNEKLIPRDIFLDTVEVALSSGVSILQYRDKSTDNKKRLYQAHALKKLCAKYNALFIINDDIELALTVNADGIHLGNQDATLKQARQQIGHDKIIGISCYNQISLAKQAIADGADYIAFGRFFDSTTKPDAALATSNLITTLKEKHNTPICCIGGITTDNCQPLINAGTDMLAVIGDIFSQTSNQSIQQQCQAFTDKFTS